MSLFGLLPQGVADAASEPSFLNALAGAANQEGIASPEHKGLFGINGNFRDILGILGDAFLINSGNAPIYRQQRQLEGQGDALSDGISESSLARLAKINPELAQKYYGDYLSSRDRQAKLAADGKNDAIRNEDALRKSFGGIFGAANESTYGPLLANARERAKELGYENVLQGLPDSYDKAGVEAWVRGTMEAKEQANVDYRNTRAGQFDRQIAETARHNAATESIGKTNAKTSLYRASATHENQRRSGQIAKQNANTAERRAANSGKSRAVPNIPPPPPPRKRP